MKNLKLRRGLKDKYMSLSLYTPKPPLGWQRLTFDEGIISPVQKRDWQLVLNARGITWHLCKVKQKEYIFVSAFLLNTARYELAAYNRENSRSVPNNSPLILHTDWALGPLILLIPAIQYGFQKGIFSFYKGLPEVNQWFASGKLDAIQIEFHHQWWRLATALTLHADLAHLIGNIFFGAIFLAILARLCGAGWAWFIATVGGVLGNWLSVIIHTLNYTSIGFSTAVFSALGGIAGIRFTQISKNALLPIGGALALLALLGVEGEHTDYGAHISGLLCGGILGYLYYWGKNIIPQWLAGMCAIGILLCGWKFALAL